MKASNVKAMREALKKILYLTNSLDEECAVDPVEIRDIARDAISTPPRNCDVGTPEEQEVRFTKFCRCKDCKMTCPFSDDYDHYRCEFAWEQMPYEEGGAK